MKSLDKFITFEQIDQNLQKNTTLVMDGILRVFSQRAEEEKSFNRRISKQDPSLKN